MRTRTQTFTKPMQALVVITLILTLVIPLLLPSAGRAAPSIQPQLLQIVEADPDQTVRVIVQKTKNSQMAEALAVQLGGRVVADLSMIHAFAVTMEAGQAVKLSRSPYVNWVSLDASVEGAGKPPPTSATFYVRDYFDQSSFSNNDGSAGWVTDWIEDDLAGVGPLTGNVSIAMGELFLKDYPDTGTEPSLTRTVNLAGATAATLSLRFRVGPGVEAYEDSVLLEISSDGGATFSTLAAFNKYNGNTNGSMFSNILDYASENTTLRFRVESGYSDSDEYFAVEYLQIEYDGFPYQTNTFLETLNVFDVWDMGIDGTGIGVAIIDSGVNKETDLRGSIKVQKSFNPNSTTVNDVYGHGTHVAGIIGMDGSGSDGYYYGIAPGADLISLKVNDEAGMAYESDVVSAMQWVYDNMATYNIRIVNLSINSTVESSYHNSPLDAAAEILWFNGVVVVTSAGNYWDGSDFNPVLAAPANDPFLITVGAADEKGTTRTRDDSIANYSAFGNTLDGYFKPDIYAPGSNIISTLSAQSDWDMYTDRVVGNRYFRLSGTSMATPMVSGAVALLLQAEPDLTPDQVKYRLLNCFDWIGPSKYLNINQILTCGTTESANVGLEASQLLWTGDEPVVWGSVAWNSVAWNSVAWNSVAWNSVAWNSVAWNSVAWNE